jgi:hypothetical protein
MSESAEDSPPAPSKPLLLTTFFSDAELPTFQLNQRLPESLLTMFESVLKSIIQGLNSLWLLPAASLLLVRRCHCTM